ncbi:MAG: hypothetical protein JNN15_14615, partial [Blastocatellia bacterium]|nr:hypothetical protein [Blastocatellia bacterium]
VKSSRPFAIMGFNYERGVAEMLHNLCHRAESTMRHFYGGWRKNPLLTNWDKFAANASKSNGEAGVGDCHFPPNATSDYDYANFSPVESTADDWLNYPNLTGKKTKVSATSWGGPDYQLNYIMWWFTRFPRAEGTNPDGRVNNWWRYLFNFNDYKSDGSPK